MNDRYQRLRDAIAAGPTPGVRRISDDGMSVIDDTGGAILSRRPDGCSSRHVERGAQQAANVLLAAAADPETIAALIAERDALRKLVAAGCLLSAESEEIESDDGMERCAGLDYWHEFEEKLAEARRVFEGGDDAPL